MQIVVGDKPRQHIHKIRRGHDLGELQRQISPQRRPAGKLNRVDEAAASEYHLLEKPSTVSSVGIRLTSNSPIGDRPQSQALLEQASRERALSCVAGTNRVEQGEILV